MQDVDHVRAYFDGQAAAYDEYTAGDAWTPNRELASALRAIVAGGARITTVLDLGTGTGLTLAAVRDVLPDARLTGVDVSGAMLARARVRVPGAELVQDDLARHVRESRRRVDLVTAVGCSENVADFADVLARVAGLVTPGGHVAVTVEVASAPVRGPDVVRHRMGDLLASLSGFTTVHESRFVAYHRGDDAVRYDLALARRPA